MNISKYFVFIVLLTCLTSYSQQEKRTALQVLQKASEVFNKQEYVTYNSTYALYLDYKTDKVYEQYSGIVLKKNNVNYYKIKQTEFVSFNDYGLKINNEQKALMVQKGNELNETSPLALNSYLKGFQVKFIETNNKLFYVCELTPPKVSQLMLHKVIFYINKTDFSIGKQKLFFVEKMQSKNNKGVSVYTIPRLEINFTKRVKNESKDNLLVTKSNYLTIKGNTFILSKKLASYKLYKS